MVYNCHYYYHNPATLHLFPVPRFKFMFITLHDFAREEETGRVR